MLILKPLSIHQSVAGAKIPAVIFIAQARSPARELAHMFDSLVRVSRRVEQYHFVIGFKSGGALTHPAACARFPEAAVQEVKERTATKPARISPKRSSPNRFRAVAVNRPDREKRGERRAIEEQREERRETRQE